MSVIRAKFSSITAICLMLVLALGLAPAVAALHHGPNVLAVEAHPHMPIGHDHSDRAHDASDHDHVSVVVLDAETAETHPDPDRSHSSGLVIHDGSVPEGPRRPPRLVML